MPRNHPVALTKTTAMRAYRLRDALVRAQEQGISVRLEYVKRDRTYGASEGTVSFFSGQDGMDTMSVTLDTADKGPRTINLCRVYDARPSEVTRA